MRIKVKGRIELKEIHQLSEKVFEDPHKKVAKKKSNIIILKQMKKP